MSAADWQGFDKRKAESAARNKLRGRGIGSYLEVTGPPAKEYGGIRFEDDGTITMLSGTLDYGQGHATPFAQVLTDKLGIPFERFRLLQGDSDQLKVGGGTGGSKSALVASQAFLEAGDKLIEQGKQIAAHVLEASAVDIEFARGRFTIAGTDRGVSIIELADKLRVGSEAAARRAAVARRQPHLGQSAVLVSQRLPRRRGRDRSRHRRRSRWCATSWSTTSARSSIRCWSRARRMAASSRASARR